MKYYKTTNTYKASNLSFNLDTQKAVSYDWWAFVKPINGQLVFNEYPYSVTTRAHQRKIKTLLENLGISIDLTVFIKQGLDGDYTKNMGVLELVEESKKQENQYNEQKRLAKAERNKKYRESKKTCKTLRLVVNN